jgi:tetratricopeptide (TPR) repeat protein
LPWLIAAGALIFYVCTMAKAVSPAGLADLAKAAGWSWQPIYVEPLHFLLTYPIRWLPAGWQVIGMNLFGALCAAGALGLLARSVAILPHDRTRDQRFMERSDYSWLTIKSAWLPPVFAALACGLQLTFWENSVVATGETLDLLLFAFIIRNLLEYRIDHKESRLTTAALVYGLGMTNDFNLIAFFPGFVVAVVWLRGLAFFNWRFLLRMTLFGLAGLSLYLLLPAIQALDGQSQQSFFEVLRVNLGFQKNKLASFPRSSLNLLLIGLVSVGPVLFMAIKWPASFADISAAGTALTNLMMHVIHALFLVACVAVTFDPQFSARNLLPSMLYPMLLCYFLGALSIGYFSGYFLLVFRNHPGAKGWRRQSRIGTLTNYAVTPAIWIALVAVPVALVYRNLPQIQANTAPYLSQLGVFQAQALKQVAPQGAIVLSDDPYRLFALDAALREAGGSQNYVLVDTTSLPWPRYHQHLYDRYPQQWLQPPADLKAAATLDSGRMVRLMGFLARSRDIFYLHPSFGYYFEHFYLKPENLVYRLKSYPTNTIAAPSLSADEIIAQDTFWIDFKLKQLAPLLRDIKRLRIEDQPNLSLALAGSIYSRSINEFGVMLQRAGELEKAALWFETALELNPDNPSAFINLDYNRLLRAGQRENMEPSEGAQKRLAPYGGKLDAILSANGAVDEPNVCFRLAELFARGRHYRQAAQYAMRVIHYMPEDLSAHLGLVSMMNQLQRYDEALAAITDIRARFGTNVVNSPAEVELIQCEAAAYVGRKDSPAAEKILLAAQKTHPKEPEPFSALAEIYMSQNQITTAEKVLDQALQSQPDEPAILTHYARLKILNNDFEAAIPYLNRALEKNDKNIYALLNRARAHLKSHHLDEALRDYETLDGFAPNESPVVCYGLHEIHWRKKQRRSAIKYGRQFLKLVPPTSAEAKEVQARLAKLDSGSF